RGVGELTELPSEQEADLLADVYCVVADALQLPGHHVHLDSPFQERWIVSQLYHFVIHATVEEIHRVVHLGELQTQLEVPTLDRLHGGPHHSAHHVRHLGEVGQDHPAGG